MLYYCNLQIDYKNFINNLYSYLKIFRGFMNAQEVTKHASLPAAQEVVRKSQFPSLYTAILFAAVAYVIGLSRT